MTALLLTNLIYVAFRVLISGPLVKLLSKTLPYYWAVFIMAQLSFAYDAMIFQYYFGAQELSSVWSYLISDIWYTIRVLLAWWMIKQLWNWCENYWLAVFLGAQITFFCDYFIFNSLFT